MAEKILGLLSAFVLGAVGGFFYFVYSLKFCLEHNLWGMRSEIREFIERYEPHAGPFELPSDFRVAALRAGSLAGQFHFDATTIEQGMRAASGRCGQCGSPEDVRGTLGGPLCRACVEFWSMPPS